MMNIKKSINKHRGKICWGAGLLVGGALVYTISKNNLDGANETIKKLKEGLQDTESYANQRAKEIAYDILDDASQCLFEIDESPESVASYIAVNTLNECQKKYFDVKALSLEACHMIEDTVTCLLEEGAIEIKEGK